jgi:peptidoglycan-N-acetylglucosamine deacetylase
VWPVALLRGLFYFAVASVIIIGGANCALAVRRHRRRRRQVWPAAEDMHLPVSVVLAAYNEQKVIGRTLESILASDYPIMEVIVVDDGSSDFTADVVLQYAQRDSRVSLISQANTGKSGALNHGIAKANAEYVVTLDADTILTQTTVTNLVRHFAVDTSGRLGAVAGVVRVGNRDRNVLTRWQALEYLTQIGVERAAQDALGAISIVPGACAAWRRDAILEVGGYDDSTLAEDCDLSLSLHRGGWRVTQDDESLAYTEAPENVDALLAQRTRWVFGTLQAIYKHRDMLLRRRYGWLGCYVLPNYVISIVVPILFLPFVAVMGVQAVQQQGLLKVLAYFLMFLLAHLGVATVGVVLMRDNRHHLPLVPVYRIVYEPLRAYLLYTSAYMALRGVRAGWNKLARTGAMDSAVTSDLPRQPALITLERTTR